MQPEPADSPRRSARRAHAAPAHHPAVPVPPKPVVASIGTDAFPTRRSLREAAERAAAEERRASASFSRMLASAGRPGTAERVSSAGPASTAGRASTAGSTTRGLLRSRKFLVSSAIVATGVLVGSGFVVQTTVTANQAAADRAASTAQTQADVVARVEQSKIDAEAQNALAKANAVVGQAATKVDATPLIASIASLNNYTQLDTQTVTALTTQTVSQADTIAAAAAEADRVAAEAAAAAAAKAEADAAAAAEAAAEALAEGNTVAGAKATASRLASSEYGWGDSQFSCLASLWSKESGWNYEAYNASSGATGIPQALPGSKMATIADDWETNATTQILWGLAYIKGSYGTPCAAWSHSQSVNWY